MSSVFVGIPTFNRPQYLPQALSSLQAQTLTTWRAIVSDNASAPDAAATERACVESLGDPRIRFVAQPVNGGEYGQGRFFADQLGDDDYFVILHDDDRLEPGYLAAATAALDSDPEADLYLADPTVIDESGAARADLTSWYLKYHGRGGGARTVTVMDRVLEDGFFPISGTCFRCRSVRNAGLVDPGLEGNYPFELNVLLRLGERGAKARYNPSPEIAVRIHPGALRHTDRLMDNASVVENMIALLEPRQFNGRAERRRRMILGRLYRARAELALRSGDVAASREAAEAAVAAFCFSKNTLLAAFGVFAWPRWFRRRLLRRSAPSFVPAPPAAQRLSG